MEGGREGPESKGPSGDVHSLPRDSREDRVLGQSGRK